MEPAEFVEDYLNQKVSAAKEADMSLSQFIFDQERVFNYIPSTLFIIDLRTHHPEREIEGHLSCL